MNLKHKLLNHLHYLYYLFLVKTSRLIKSQRQNPLSIPILIINFNQLNYLKKLLYFLKERGFENIVIIDNLSTYPPLLEFYKTLESPITIEYMKKNYGHKVFFENKELQQKYGRGYYVITDADILPNQNLPTDFMYHLIEMLDLYFKRVTKVGFALDIKDIPDTYALKDKVITWEKRFWINPITQDRYLNWIDTTFALYKPMYPNNFNDFDFLDAIRIAGNYTSKHGGWYLNTNNLTDEQKYYFNTVNGSSSWRIDEQGNNNTSKYNTSTTK